jgi:Amt family ammonium transporter
MGNETMKIATMKTGLGALALLPGLAMAAPAVADKADNAFMMICTALVLFMTSGCAVLRRPDPR